MIRKILESFRFDTHRNMRRLDLLQNQMVISQLDVTAI